MGSPVLNAGRDRRKRTFHQHLIAMARYIAALALLGAVLADGTGHSAPAASYGAPSYEEPSYAAPAASYGAPSYDTPSYDAADTVDGFDLSKILDLLPLFIAVFAAIILAQLIAPLFGVLFNAKVGLLGGIINPFGQAKIDLINMVLIPLGYQICNSNGTCPAVWNGRSLNTLTTLTDGEFSIMNALEIAEKLYGAHNDSV